MSTELEDRLRRLAAEVDLDDGRAEQRARQARRARRRLLVGAAAAVAVAAVAVTGVALLDRSGDDGESDDDVVAGPGPEPQTTTAADGGIEIEVTALPEAEAGTQLWFDVVVRNVGDATVYWQAGGCRIPVDASVGPVSDPVPDVMQPGDDEPPRWDGDVGGLGAWLAEHNVLPAARHHRPADMTGRRDMVCTDDLNAEPLEPGGDLRHRGSFEMRMPPGDLPDGGRYELVVAFSAFPDMNVADEAPPTVEVRAPLTVTDDPGRTAGSSDGAIDAFAADPRLADWIVSTEVPDRPDLVQEFTTELSWWRGAWELWVDPYWAEHRVLRMRYDPAGGEVVDVRTVPRGQAPEDEPGRSGFPEEEPDEVL